MERLTKRRRVALMVLVEWGNWDMRLYVPGLIGHRQFDWLVRKGFAEYSGPYVIVVTERGLERAGQEGLVF